MAKAKKEVSKAMAKLNEALSNAVEGVFVACDDVHDLGVEYEEKDIRPVRAALAKYDKVKEKIKAQAEKEKK